MCLARYQNSRNCASFACRRRVFSCARRSHGQHPSSVGESPAAAWALAIVSFDERPLGRVDLGGCSPRSPTDPGVHVKCTRFVTLWNRCPSHDWVVSR